jgi:hypothetical protein
VYDESWATRGRLAGRSVSGRGCMGRGAGRGSGVVSGWWLFGPRGQTAAVNGHVRICGVTTDWQLTPGETLRLRCQSLSWAACGCTI